MKTAKRADASAEVQRTGPASRPRRKAAAAAQTEGVDRDVEELLDRGDRRGAVTLLHHRYAAKLVACLAPICGQAAEDIVQKTFEQAFRDIDSHQRKVPVRAWLRAIANHRATDHVREQIRLRNRFVPLDEEIDQAAPERSAEQGLDTRQRLALLGKALSELAPHVSFAIVLRHIEGLSYPEMVELCGAKAPALERRVARGMNELRKKLYRLARTEGTHPQDMEVYDEEGSNV